MRANLSTLLIASSLLVAAAACDESPAEMKDPPVLRITSPRRSLIQRGAGMVTVSGTVTPNELSQEPVEKVLVNGVQAIVSPDGSFSATMFYVDCEGHPQHENVRLALEELSFFSSKMKILGVYKSARSR